MSPKVDELLTAYLQDTPGRKETSRSPAPPAASGTLEDLLKAYLHTVGEDGADFALPRSSDVDELLRRYVLDQEDVKGALESTLRQHVAGSGEHAVVPARGVQGWTRETAARIRQADGLDERLNQYATAVADQDEQAHAFTDDHESTLKGVPPPNAPPISLGSELARHLRKKNGSGSHSPVE